MKTTTHILIVVTASAFALHVGTASGQPATAPRLDPATGLPESSSAQPSAINAATGMPMAKSDERTPWTAIQDASQTQEKVRTLIFNSQYGEALQLCLAYHEQYETSSSWSVVLPAWVELGRRYPKAEAALVEIRDHDVHEFSSGQQFADLFSEINSIDRALNQDDVTYDLFKSFRDKDPELADQCYSYVADLLMAKGDYQWCYNHMGEPQQKFDSIHQSLTMQLDNQKRMAARNEENKRCIAEINQQHGWTNTYNPPDPSARLKEAAENGFVSQVRQEVEILIATGHKTEAEKIRDEAVAVLDDDRLKSAVADAKAKVKNQSN